MIRKQRPRVGGVCSVMMANIALYHRYTVVPRTGYRVAHTRAHGQEAETCNQRARGFFDTPAAEERDAAQRHRDASSWFFFFFAFPRFRFVFKPSALTRRRSALTLYHTYVYCAAACFLTTRRKTA